MLFFHDTGTGAGEYHMLDGLDDVAVRVMNIGGVESVGGGGGPSYTASHGPAAFPVAQVSNKIK